MSFLEKIRGMRRSKSKPVINEDGGGEEVGKKLEKRSNSQSLAKMQAMENLLNIRRVKRRKEEMKS